MDSKTLLFGRLLFSAIFILSGLNHFSTDTIAAASLNGVPAALVLVPLTGLLCVFGGVSIALGWRTRQGATALVAFLLPATALMHRFWSVNDPQAALTQQAHFMKNLALLGAALVIRYFGAGPVSVDAWRSNAQS